MQRIFAFDPGTSAIGWAVLDSDRDTIAIVAAGVRLFALSRHRALQRMRQRLKPEQRMKLRQRMNLRRTDLADALVSCGLMTTAAQDRHWEHDDGTDLRHWLSLSLKEELPDHPLVRILFNAHKHRGESAYWPDKTSARQFVDALLTVQSRWHAPLQKLACREHLLAVMFRRRAPQKSPTGARPISPLAAVSHSQFKVTWHALVRKFGLPQAVRIEAALPASRKASVNAQERSQLTERLATIARPPTRQNLLRLRLFQQQANQSTGFAECRISGSKFGFAEAFSPMIEIDHSVPVARNGAGGRHNLALSFAVANRAKGSALPDGVQTSLKPPNRVQLADADALRQAVTLSLEFLQTQGTSMDLQLVSPRKVALVRQALLDKDGAKNRSDLRHHAVDAILTGTVQDKSADCCTLGGRFAAMINAALETLVVSTKPERSKRGQKHDDTRYGRPSVHSGFDPGSHICSRKPVAELTAPMLRRLADRGLRKRIADMNASGADDLAAMFGRTKRVKVVHVAHEAIDVSRHGGVPAYAVLPFDNHHLDIVQMRDGAWKAYGATRHQVTQRGWRPEWERERVGGKLVMRLHKGDMVEITGADGNLEIMTVIRLGGAAGTVHLARNSDCGTSRALDENVEATTAQKPRAFAARSLQKHNARSVNVDPTGTITHRKSNADKVRTRLLG